MIAMPKSRVYRTALGVLLAGCVVVAAALWLGRTGDRTDSTTAPPLGDLIGAIERGDADAASAARKSARQ